MGALIPVGGGADAEIKDRLNRTFSFDNLTALQDNTAVENFFDDNHKLHRVAFRLGCYPIQGAEKSRKKWFYLLKNTLPAANYNPPGGGPARNTAAAIKTLLGYALDPTKNIVRVIFDAVEDTAAPQHYVHPDNLTPQVRVGRHNQNTLTILLVCPRPLDPGNLENIPDGEIDKDAGGNSVERPLPF